MPDSAGTAISHGCLSAGDFGSLNEFSDEIRMCHSLWHIRTGRHRKNPYLTNNENRCLLSEERLWPRSMSSVTASVFTRIEINSARSTGVPHGTADGAGMVRAQDMRFQGVSTDGIYWMAE